MLQGFRNRGGTEATIPEAQIVSFRPFLSSLRPASSLNAVSNNDFPIVEEPKTQLVSSQQRKRKQKWKEDLIINSTVVAENADTKSPEYRETIRQFFVALKLKFLTLTRTDFANANRRVLTDRSFQRWCTPEHRKKDKQ